MFRLSAAWLLGGVCAIAVVTTSAQQQPPKAAGNSGGGVTGVVTVPEGQRLPEMVVYLESTDPKFTFQVSDVPVPVSQKGAKFSPGLLVVPVGTSVDFRNDEPREVEHNVFSNSETKKFDLGLYKPGDTVPKVKFETPGAVRLRCSIHRYMDGVVYVTPTPFFAVVGKDGSFSITGVRPGAYKLKTWQRSQRYREQEIPVTVAAGKSASVPVGLSR
jgi:plastocyanin